MRQSFRALSVREGEREREDGRKKTNFEREWNEIREMQIECRKDTYESLKRNLFSTFKKWSNFPLS